MTESSENHYEILEISEDATSNEITAARNRLIQQFHPDKVPEHLERLRDVAKAKTSRINEAYDVLKDPARRKHYDESLRRKREPRSRPQQPQPKPDAPMQSSRPNSRRSGQRSRPEPGSRPRSASSGRPASGGFQSSARRPRRAFGLPRLPRLGAPRLLSVLWPRPAIAVALVVLVVLGIKNWGEIPPFLRALTVVGAAIGLIAGLILTFNVFLAVIPILLIILGLTLAHFLGTFGWILALGCFALAVGGLVASLKDPRERTFRSMFLGALWLLPIVGAYPAIRTYIFHSADQSTRQAILREVSVAGVQGDTLRIDVDVESDVISQDVEPGDIVSIIRLDDHGDGVQLWHHTLWSSYGEVFGTHTNLENRRGMPQLRSDTWDEFQYWRSFASPEFWPLLSVDKRFGKNSRWHTLEEGMAFEITEKGRLVFGLNRSDHKKPRSARYGHWTVHAVVGRATGVAEPAVDARADIVTVDLGLDSDHVSAWLPAGSIVRVLSLDDHGKGVALWPADEEQSQRFGSRTRVNNRMAMPDDLKWSYKKVGPWRSFSAPLAWPLLMVSNDEGSGRWKAIEDTLVLRVETPGRLMFGLNLPQGLNLHRADSAARKETAGYWTIVARIEYGERQDLDQ